MSPGAKRVPSHGADGTPSGAPGPPGPPGSAGGRESGYELLDSGGQRKLERFGAHRLVRPAAQAVWAPKTQAAWQQPDATFVRDATGNGTWHLHGALPSTWSMDFGGLRWELARNDFGHVGIFPEQEPCWRWIRAQVRAAPTPPEVLNLFAYTGGSTLAAAAAGAHVVHVDASKTSVRSARTNAERSGLAERPVRWIVDDVQRFVERELRRARRYQGIVLDPPTFGRGSRGELWRIDEHLPPLLALLGELLEGPRCFCLLTCHSPGFTPLVLANLLEPLARGPLEHGEMTLIEAGVETGVETGGRALPSGAFARWEGAH